MSISRSIILSIAALTSILAISSTATVHADTTTTSTATTCSVVASGTKNTAGNSDSRFSLNSDGTVSASVVVTGTDCNVPVTITSWQAPDAAKGLPYSAQTVFAHTTETFSTGTHTISVALPNCFYQVDLLPGTNPTGIDGGAQYPTGTLIGSLHGGTQVCGSGGGGSITPTPTPTVLPDTGSGSNIFVFSALAALVGYGVTLVRKARA